MRSVSERCVEVMNLEASLKWFIVLWFRIDFSDGVVARDRDPLWSQLYAASFGLCSKRIVVCPLLKVVSTDLIRT